MLAEQRQQVILEMLRGNKVVKLNDICAKTNCSASSARRDLQILEEQGSLIRIHGGAKAKHALQRELDMLGKASQNVSAKDQLAQLAATRIADEDVLFLDAGTSTLALVPYLRPDQHLTVVTNAVPHASQLADQGVRTILLGGMLKNTTKAIIGVKAVRDLQHYRFNKVFLGINGVHDEFGLTTPDPDEAAVKQAALSQAEEAFVLADKSKFDSVSFVKVADLAEVTLITTGLSHPVFEKYSRQTNILEG
ncbi:DeoR family transcriptional regulator [Ligilactobacillus salitolerans]|uniref:DeoR family transcriptional regulator n=1 Tax=Ligilactobacillus salitolerans TaxID=1808352 RepID=A0A401IW68_9LACO|nr:DeoR/GlpR family DNA-binding transcription regulator [Ligilactobacillus salitolerans]GBG95746.1 DeoR family transcriptional regulator [Ligilactobacillus salitolerans]